MTANEQKRVIDLTETATAAMLELHDLLNGDEHKPTQDPSLSLMIDTARGVNVCVSYHGKDAHFQGYSNASVLCAVGDAIRRGNQHKIEVKV